MRGKIVSYGRGLWGPEFDEPYSVVGAFLSSDVGYNTAMCDYHIDRMKSVAKGGKVEEVCGNHTIVRITPKWVLISSQFDEVNPAVLSMDACLHILEYWKSVVETCDVLTPPTATPDFFYEDPSVKDVTTEGSVIEFSKLKSDWSESHHGSVDLDDI